MGIYNINMNEIIVIYCMSNWGGRCWVEKQDKDNHICCSEMVRVRPFKATFGNLKVKVPKQLLAFRGLLRYHRQDCRLVFPVDVIWHGTGPLRKVWIDFSSRNVAQAQAEGLTHKLQ